jgi:hypothetical protein
MWRPSGKAGVLECVEFEWCNLSGFVPGFFPQNARPFGDGLGVLLSSGTKVQFGRFLSAQGKSKRYRWQSATASRE